MVQIYLELRAGIEPAYSDYKTEILPLNYRSILFGGRRKIRISAPRILENGSGGRSQTDKKMGMSHFGPSGHPAINLFPLCSHNIFHNIFPAARSSRGAGGGCQ